MTQAAFSHQNHNASFGQNIVQNHAQESGDLTWREPLLVAAQAGKLQGRLGCDVSLAAKSWFGVGGAADLLFRPQTRQDLQSFLAILPAQVPLTILGATSNLLIRDGGIRGAVVRLGRDFAVIHHHPNAPGNIMAGGAALDVSVAEYAANLSVAGLEFLVGIPGSMGGAVAMNAGAFGGETKDILTAIEIMDRLGTVTHVTAKDLHMTYRHTDLPPDLANFIIIAAHLQGKLGDETAIRQKMTAIKQQRDASQPLRSKTGGSTFKNPASEATAHLPADLKKAWQLINAAGCRGLRRGAAMVSDKHCNFLLNLGDSTASEIEALGEEIRQRVLNKFSVDLEWEIKKLGEPLNASAQKGGVS
ncbi:MAG: UDP-N-acetylmuramate dehydrogenase [Alphaproteobacteria bacterium]|nr:UDP-N-acetylmuramate dehydrogenase [Alphaproteobacteria bacterium]